MMAICVPRLREASTSVRVIRSTAPDRTSPAEITSTSATTTTAGWPKPANASLAGTRPRMTARSSVPKATMS